MITTWFTASLTTTSLTMQISRSLVTEHSLFSLAKVNTIKVPRTTTPTWLEEETPTFSKTFNMMDSFNNGISCTLDTVSYTLELLCSLNSQTVLQSSTSPTSTTIGQKDSTSCLLTVATPTTKVKLPRLVSTLELDHSKFQMIITLIQMCSTIVKVNFKLLLPDKIKVIKPMLHLIPRVSILTKIRCCHQLKKESQFW